MGGLDGSDDLLVLEMELILDGPELAVGQSRVNFFGKERHCHGHHALEVVESLERNLGNL